MKKDRIFKSENVSLILGDSLVNMSQLEENSFDIAICDPPYGAASKSNWSYNSDAKLKGFGGNWNLANNDWDFLSFNDNFNLSIKMLSELRRIVKPTGSIWIHSTYHNSGFVNVACQFLGLEIINEVIWFKRNAFPNLAGKRLTASHETILWAHTGGLKRQYRFNYEDVKRSNFEYDSIKKKDKQMRTVWDIPNNKSKAELMFDKHPTQKPLRLTERLLLISGIKGGDLIVPFSGSGTEIIAGIKYGMQVTAFEINPSYFNISKKRVEYYEASNQNLFK